MPGGTLKRVWRYYRVEGVELSEEQEYIQCVCGRLIKDPSEYKVVYIKKENRELDILCPNDTCYLRELGFIQFRLEGDKPRITKATFYSPFVTWNVARLGKDKATQLLKQHLQALIRRCIDWNKIVEETKKQIERERAAAAAASGESGETG
ncbi:MAG: hypothetical protein DRJ67_05995 [Thermoprotei archaeon]|nr:MAG: hypothetical protein DRJ67_05995 [Thermoprotei archaeon]